MKKYWKQLTLVFLVGLILGMALGHLSLRPFHRGWGQNGKGFDKKFKHFTKKLDLTDDQAQKIKTLHEAKRKEMEALREEMAPRHQEFRETFKAEVRSLLNEDQLKKFETLEAKRAKRRAKRGGKPRWRHGK